MDRRIAIIGGGISSMYAILACHENGIKPDVYAKEISPPVGAVYLRFLPKFIKEEFEFFDIKTLFSGDRKSYIIKQWSKYPKSYKSSFPRCEFVSKGYNPIKVLKRVFEDCTLMDYIKLNSDMTDEDIEEMSYEYDFIFHSFPSKSSRKLMSKYVVKIPILVKDEYPTDRNYVFYNGDPNSIVVRESSLFGIKYIELSPRIDFSLDELSKLYPKFKIRFSYDLSPEILDENLTLLDSSSRSNVFSIGRVGKFNRGELGNDTYSYVDRVLNGKTI